MCLHTNFYLQVVTDLVQGEFMQLGSKETENERFAHYLTKIYRKTATLMANSVKSVSMHIQSHVTFQFILSSFERPNLHTSYFVCRWLCQQDQTNNCRTSRTSMVEIQGQGSKWLTIFWTSSRHRKQWANRSVRI